MLGTAYFIGQSPDQTLVNIPNEKDSLSSPRNIARVRFMFRNPDS